MRARANDGCIYRHLDGWRGALNRGLRALAAPFLHIAARRRPSPPPEHELSAPLRAELEALVRHSRAQAVHTLLALDAELGPPVGLDTILVGRASGAHDASQGLPDEILRWTHPGNNGDPS